METLRLLGKLPDSRGPLLNAETAKDWTQSNVATHFGQAVSTVALFFKKKDDWIRRYDESETRGVMGSADSAREALASALALAFCFQPLSEFLEPVSRKDTLWTRFHSSTHIFALWDLSSTRR